MFRLVKRIYQSVIKFKGRLLSSLELIFLLWSDQSQIRWIYVDLYSCACINTSKVFLLDFFIDRDLCRKLGDWFSSEVYFNAEWVSCSLDVKWINREESLLSIDQLDHQNTVTWLFALWNVLSQIVRKVVQSDVQDDLSEQVGLASWGQNQLLWFVLRTSVFTVGTSADTSEFRF